MRRRVTFAVVDRRPSIAGSGFDADGDKMAANADCPAFALPSK